LRIQFEQHCIAEDVRALDLIFTVYKTYNKSVHKIKQSCLLSTQKTWVVFWAWTIVLDI